MGALRYKPEGRGFDPRWCHWNFSLTQSFWQHYGPGVDSASNRNEYQEYFLGGKDGRCVWLTLPPSCAHCLEIWESQPPGTLRACPGLLFFILNITLLKKYLTSFSTFKNSTFCSQREFMSFRWISEHRLFPYKAYTGSLGIYNSEAVCLLRGTS